MGPSAATGRGNAGIGLVRPQSALPTTGTGQTTRTAVEIALRQSVARLLALPLDTNAEPPIGYVFRAEIEKCVRRTQSARMRSVARPPAKLGILAIQVGL